VAGLDYDELGRLVRVEDRTLGRVVEYAYDAAGNRSSLKVDTGEQVQYRWDAAGRLSETVDPQGQATRFTYDAAGRRTGTAYGNGTRATYAYDAAGQVLAIGYLDSQGGVQTAFGYGYDASGNRTHKAYADGTRETYGYDALNRLVAVDYPATVDAPAGRHVEYAYDAVGNRKELLDTTVAPVERWAASATASSSYAASGQGSPSGATGAPDAAACQAGVYSPQWTAGFEGYYSTRDEWLELTYVAAERVRGVRIHETMGSAFVVRVDLVEENGAAHTVYEGGDTTACGSWLEVRFPLTAYKAKKAKVYTRYQGTEGIDAVGLLVQPADRYEYNGFNQLLSLTPGSGGTATTFGYDGNGNQTTKTDGAGQTTYVYDGDNRLVGISGPGLTNAFEYDANGLRVKKTDSSGTTRYLLDGLSMIAQYAPDGQRQAWYTQSLARIDEVLSVVNDSGKQWYQADALGSVYGLTNASGNLVGHQGYDVFGAPTPAPSGPAGQPFGFTGREHELDSGLVYARARYLNPAVGRWDRPDPLGMVDGPNRYQYVRGRATQASDPMGWYLSDIHLQVTRQAFNGVLTGADLEAVVHGSVEADDTPFQFQDYRHGMRAANTTLEQGAKAWADFIDGELADAIAILNGNCGLGLKEAGFRRLGYGVHALEDYYSPPHRMQVMSWTYLPVHIYREKGIGLESASVGEALRSAKEYALLFSWLRGFGGRMSLDRSYVADMAWAMFGHLAYIDVISQ
jgi:RHS repeat-associated protein